MDIKFYPVILLWKTYWESFIITIFDPIDYMLSQEVNTEEENNGIQGAIVYIKKMF